MERFAVESRDLHKSYGSLEAVAGIDLTVRRGEIFGLVGPDGSGKTTTIQMLCTLSRPSAGQARVLNMDTVKMAERIKPRIGYMSERFTLYPTLTVEENIDFFARLRQVNRAVLEQRKKELLGFSRLDGFRHRLSEQLSGGMQKKLALCCSLIHKPEIIFLDEPTNGVDPISRRDFWLIILRFVSEGVTFVVSTSYLDEAERFNRVALMHLGKIVACGTPRGLESTLRGDLLQVTTEYPHKALLALRDMTGVSSAQVFGDNVHLLVESTQGIISDIEEVLTARNLKAVQIRPITPTLEDVFVSLLDQSGRQAAGSDRVVETSPAIANGLHGIQPPIVVSELTRKFGPFVAVNKISFEVAQGEIFGFLGPNGSGKTTTIRMLCGLLLPTSGQAFVLGQDIRSASNLVRAQMGYMSQKFSLFPDLTVWENINFYAGLYGLRAAVLEKRKEWVLDMAGLRGKEKSLPRELSAGWKQRLSLGCSVIHRPRVVFLDEPTSGVDPVSRRFFWEFIHELAGHGTTILVTTHYMDEAEHCQRLGLMHQGELIAVGSPSQLKNEQARGKILEITCSDLPRAIELLSIRTDFRQLSLFGASIHLVVDRPNEDYRDIRDILEGNGISVQGLGQVPFTMEDAFVSIMEKRNTSLPNPV
jgi:ABC-2 type transport system ATP-binding protein